MTKRLTLITVAVIGSACAASGCWPTQPLGPDDDAPDEVPHDDGGTDGRESFTAAVRFDATPASDGSERAGDRVRRSATPSRA